jgi:hypothetical protein
MYRKSMATGVADLRVRWCRWTAIVELFADRRRGRFRVDPRVYQATHRGLTEACRSRADSSDEAERAFYRNLEGLVQPWLDTGVFARADREILLDLLIRCRQAERDLGSRARRRAAPRSAVSAIMASAVLVALALSGLSEGGAWSRVLGRVQGWTDPLRLTLKLPASHECLFHVSIIVIPVALSVVSRATRSGEGS